MTVNPAFREITWEQVLVPSEKGQIVEGQLPVVAMAVVFGQLFGVGTAAALLRGVMAVLARVAGRNHGRLTPIADGC